VLVPPHDPIGLTRAIAALLGDSARREQIGAAARAHARADFGAAAWAARHLELYAEVARSRSLDVDVATAEETRCAS